MQQNKGQQSYPNTCNISQLLTLANQQQLVQIFDQIKHIFSHPLQQKEDVYKLVATSQGQYDDFIVNATPSLLRCHTHFSLRVQKNAMDALVYLIAACFDRFKVIVDNTDIFDALIVGFYRHWKKFVNQSMQNKVTYLIELLIAQVKNQAQTIGYSISKDRLNNYKIITNQINRLNERRVQFNMEENQFENDIVSQGKDKSEPLLLLAGVAMGLRKETTFEGQIKSFIENFSLQVLDIALKVSHSPDYDQDVIFELKRLLSKLLPQFQWIYSHKQQEDGQNQYKIVHSQSQRDTLEKYCLKLYQCYASIFNAIVLSTEKSFAPDSEEFLTSFNYCLVMLSRFYQILSKRQALQNVIVTVMESLTNGQKIKYYKNAAIFLSYWKKFGTQNFKQKLRENSKLKLIEQSEFFDNGFFLADLEDSFQVPHDLQVNNNIHLNNRFFGINDAISLNKSGFPIKIKILSGQTYKQIFQIQNQTDLIYVEFTMRERDICFSVEKINKLQMNEEGQYQEINNELIYFIQKTTGIKRIFTIKGPGMYKIKWDNSYSWLRSKVVQYRIDILSQGLSNSSSSFSSIQNRKSRTIKEFYQKYHDFKGPSPSRRCSEDNMMHSSNQDQKKEFVINSKIQAQDFDLDYVYDDDAVCKIDIKFSQDANHQNTSFLDPKSLLFEYSKKILLNYEEGNQSQKRIHFIKIKKCQENLPDSVQYISANGELKTILNINAFVWNGVNAGRIEGLMQYIRFLTGEQFKQEDIQNMSITDEALVKQAVVSVLNSK